MILQIGQEAHKRFTQNVIFKERIIYAFASISYQGMDR